MRILLFLLALILAGLAGAQPILKAGDVFPDMVIRPILNAPVQTLDIRGESRKKFLILNFWGTWCSPCLPEMDSLGKLQAANDARIQVIAISDEPVDRLRKYLQRKPSTVWLASDTGGNLYQQLALSYVGQAVILSPQGRIVAVVRTDSIDQPMIDRLLQGFPIRSSAETGKNINIEADLFAVDSSMGYQLTYSSYRPGIHSMSKTYLKSIFEGRRRTWINVCPASIYRDIYHVSYRQLVYDGPEKDFCQWDDKNSLVCLDLTVKPEQKDSLSFILLQTLNRLSPVKARLEKRKMPVFVMGRASGAPDWRISSAAGSWGFSGRGFEGTGIGMGVFSDYVANELQLPVVDETGLKDRYDIKTENALRTKEDMLAALAKLGLTVVKTEREMDVVVVYR